jgi:hypothetical protein
MVIISFASIFFLFGTLSISSLWFPSPLRPRDLNQLEIDMRQLAVDVGNFTQGINSVGMEMASP